MPRKKKRATICASRKYSWKRHAPATVTTVEGEGVSTPDLADTELKNNCAGYDKDIQTDQYSYPVDKDVQTDQYSFPVDKDVQTNQYSYPVDKDVQTDQYIISDHDYCATFNTDCADDTCANDNELNTAFIDFAENHDIDIMNDAFVLDPNVVSYTEVESTNFYAVVQEIINNLHGENVSTVVTTEKLSICQMYMSSSAAVEFCIELNSDFSCDILVHRKKLPHTHEIWDRLPAVFDQASSVIELFERLQRYHVCYGSYEEEFTSLVDIGAGLSTNQNPEIVAYREGDFGAHKYSTTIRTVKCGLLSRADRCHACKTYRQVLQKRKWRMKEKEKQDAKRVYSGTTYKHCDITRENLIKKIKEQQSEIRSMQTELWKLKREFRDVIKRTGVKVTESENIELKELMSCCSAEFEKAFPDVNSKQRLFWEQQLLHAQKSDERGMRWHPMIVRWCLYIREKSAKAYDALKDSGFINLPSTRTLFDYSHYIKGELGFHVDVLKLAKQEAQKKKLYDADWRSHVGILFDEIKIREDLVYDRHSGELVGYCNLGDIGNQMLQFENVTGGAENTVAKYILLVMLRSVSANWCYPLAAFATSSITGDFLYPIIWRTVSLVETQLKLKVLFWTCDGASSNRRFFSLHYAGNDVVYKTTNVYATDRSRNIYFISDVPHLLKTLRNNLSNSHSHKTSRRLWRNGKDISWLHIVKLFEEQCEGNLYNPCPKLTRKHIDLLSFNYMKVSLAAQVMSESVAIALEEFYGQDVDETVKFIRHVNK